MGKLKIPNDWYVFIIGRSHRKSIMIHPRRMSPAGKCYTARMEIEFSGVIWYWRGPSPYHFITVPEEQSEVIKAMSGWVTYGWGMIPVRAQIGETEFKTSLFPKDGLYIVPLKDAVRKAEELQVGEEITVRLRIG